LADTAPSNIQFLMEKDKETLNPGAWLHDTVVTLFFSVLQNTIENKQKVFFLDSCFMSKLFEGGRKYEYEYVKQWFGELDLNNADTIYVPINITRCHWILGIIQPQKKLIEICNKKFKSKKK
jgi:Ulp1 family protease